MSYNFGREDRLDRDALTRLIICLNPDAAERAETVCDQLRTRRTEAIAYAGRLCAAMSATAAARLPAGAPVPAQPRLAASCV